MTYIAHYLEPGEGLTFQRRYRDDEFPGHWPEELVTDQILEELDNEGNRVLAITHNGFEVWTARGIEG